MYNFNQKFCVKIITNHTTEKGLHPHNILPLFFLANIDFGNLNGKTQ